MRDQPTHNTNNDAASANGTAQSRLAIAFFLNAGFAAIEFVGGWWTGSIAIMADAIHDTGDALSLGFAWALAGVAQKRGNSLFSYGYRRLTLLGALITAVVLVAGSAGIIAEAIPRLLSPTQPHAPGMIGLAILGILVNGAAVLRLRGGQSMNERVVSWHLVEDILGWVAVLIASIVMLFVDLPVLDPLLSMGIAAFILWNVVASIRSTLLLFLEATPDNVTLAQIKAGLMNVAGVKDVHHIHAWSLDGEKHLATAHVVVEDIADAGTVLAIRRQAHSQLRQMGIEHATLEIEIGPDACLDS